jgi:CRP-like cAMP-binding protein
MIILLNSGDGRELVLSEMRRGDVFGENAVLTQTPRSATAQAREDTDLLQIPGRTFLTVLDEEPRLARRLLALAAARLAASNERERALAFLPAEARIVRVLRTMDDIDRQTLDKGTISMSQDELALRTGLTRQTVARFLGQWRRQGWLLTGRGRIMLLNRPALYAVEMLPDLL